MKSEILRKTHRFGAFGMIALCSCLVLAGCGESAANKAKLEEQEQELQQLRAANQELQKLKSENQELARLKRDNEEVQRLRTETKELALLREENSKLRGQLQTLKSPKGR